MAKTKKQTPGKSPKTPENQFIELVNWKKAQPRMKPGHNDWFKLYTSLLDNEPFDRLDDPARVLLIGLWMYAAHSGRHVFPADPKWIWRRIPTLNSEPDLMPLLDAKDFYGRAKPFIRYYKKREPKKKNQNPGTDVATRAQARGEERRVEEREERPNPNGFGRKEEREREERVMQAQPEQQIKQTDRKAAEPEKPVNPKESEVGSAKVHHVPKPAHSVAHRPQRLGNIITGRFPDHWSDQDAEAFGWEIVEALGMPHKPDDKRIRSEWGAFASFWSSVKRLANPMLHDEIRRVAVNKAVFLTSNKAKSARNKSAVWFKIMGGELASRGIGIPNRRAGP